MEDRKGELFCSSVYSDVKDARQVTQVIICSETRPNYWLRGGHLLIQVVKSSPFFSCFFITNASRQAFLFNAK